ncbi:hypothetical protein BCR33DRAFT_781668 [Rhizoclosmatium globosum]|uniref:Zn(2)-C6 fungal-type domain-containing protein n=1 Tax=Rhizoclosmatium globosum TaxID=329046 RepID=A0A1Y2CQT1_9FUNG|nr:hypothetical protein BCR33DRAFT_781668 [Rhizoclosmatium globosum]|eukprot:ORY49388.1 hypothetical protein BCR33DRAFT_781668 [Rhizoclosmatium globosum]
MSSAVPKATSCEQCRKSKKGCTKELGGCSGCRVKGLVCIYPPETLAALGIETSETSETRRQRPITGAKQSQANVAEQWTPPSQAAEFNSGPLATLVAPMIFDETYDDWLIHEDLERVRDRYDGQLSVRRSDLMPTWEDFECVHKYFTTDPRAPAQMAVMDAAGFMNTFFQQPPALRLVVTAMAAFCSGSAMTEESAYWFFKRARKAVILAADRPSVPQRKLSTGSMSMGK